MTLTTKGEKVEITNPIHLELLRELREVQANGEAARYQVMMMMAEQHKREFAARRAFWEALHEAGLIDTNKHHYRLTDPEDADTDEGKAEPANHVVCNGSLEEREHKHSLPPDLPPAVKAILEKLGGEATVLNLTDNPKERKH